MRAPLGLFSDLIDSARVLSGPIALPAQAPAVSAATSGAGSFLPAALPAAVFPRPLSSARGPSSRLSADRTALPANVRTAAVRAVSAASALPGALSTARASTRRPAGQPLPELRRNGVPARRGLRLRNGNRNLDRLAHQSEGSRHRVSAGARFGRWRSRRPLSLGPAARVRARCPLVDRHGSPLGRRRRYRDRRPPVAVDGKRWAANVELRNVDHRGLRRRHGRAWAATPSASGSSRILEAQPHCERRRLGRHHRLSPRIEDGRSAGWKNWRGRVGIRWLQRRSPGERHRRHDVRPVLANPSLYVASATSLGTVATTPVYLFLP